ncbi:hypothetical protein, partial [Pseudomonas sp. PS01303]|uniref:hypothetical protein n=1 Tax=Pseudomonas sp. PS01303 TaxID=2991439 RepID=UPI00249C6345
SPVGAAEGCDLLTLFFKIKRSQPSAAPTADFGDSERVRCSHGFEVDGCLILELGSKLLLEYFSDNNHKRIAP